MLETLWKEFEIPLLDEIGEPCLDNDGESIIIIANDPKSLHSTIFLTKPDKYGEQRRAHVVELIGIFHKHLEVHGQQDITFNSLQYWVIYDHPIHLKNQFTSIFLCSFDSICSLTPLNGEFWLY